MMPTLHGRSHRSAFTLMEVLLAVVASSVVLVAINGVFFGAVRLQDRTTRAVEDSLPIQRALNVIRQDLSGVMMPGGTFATDLQTTATASVGSSSNNTATSAMMSSMSIPVGPEFRTRSGQIREEVPWGDVQRVAYFLLSPADLTNRGHDLYRSVARNLLPPSTDTPETEFLLGGVESALMQFHDGTSWLDTWDSTTADPKLPAAIRMSITLIGTEGARQLPAPIELVVPLFLEARTNQTATASSDSGGGGGNP